MFCRYSDREKELRQLFPLPDEFSLVYCNGIAGLIKSMGLEYDITECRHFNESFSRSLKTVLLHNENNFSSIPLRHSVQIIETHDSIGDLLSAVNYQEKMVDLWRSFGVWTGPWAATRIYKVSSLSCISGTDGLKTNIISNKSGR